MREIKIFQVSIHHQCINTVISSEAESIRKALDLLFAYLARANSHSKATFVVSIFLRSKLPF